MYYTFVGTGSCVPDPKKNASGGILELAGQTIMIDCGTGVLYNLPRAGYDYCDIDVLCFTHYHLDHISDFPSLLFALKNDPACNRTKDLKIVAPKGFKEYHKKLEEIHGDTIINEEFSILITEALNEKLDIGKGISVLTKNTHHTEKSIGYRFEYEDKVFCASGDTGYVDNVVDLCSNANMAILECSHTMEKSGDFHLSPQTAGKIASRAQVDRLLLTHLYPEMEKYPVKDECSKFFSGEIEIAENYKKYEI